MQHKTIDYVFLAFSGGRKNNNDFASILTVKILLRGINVNEHLPRDLSPKPDIFVGGTTISGKYFNYT